MSNLSVRIDKGEGVGLGRVISFWVPGVVWGGEMWYTLGLILEKIVGELQGFGAVMRFIYETK